MNESLNLFTMVIADKVIATFRHTITQYKLAALQKSVQKIGGAFVQ